MVEDATDAKHEAAAHMYLSTMRAPQRTHLPVGPPTAAAARDDRHHAS